MRAEEQLGGYLLVRGAFAGQPRDLCLLRGEHAAGVRGSPGHAFAGGAQLGPGPVGERVHAHRVEHAEGGAELIAGVTAAAPAAQPLAVEQLGPGQLGSDPAALQVLDGQPVLGLRAVVRGKEGAAAGQLAEGVVSPAGPHAGRECPQYPGRGLPVPAAGRRLDQVHFGIPGRYQLVLEGPEPVT